MNLGPFKALADLRVLLAPVLKVPFTALCVGKDLPQAPMVGLQNAKGHMVVGVEHTFYVIPQKRITYQDHELHRLGAFIAAQDMRRAETSPLRGGFAKPVALIAKVHHLSNDHALGKRWMYQVAKGDTVRKVTSDSLEKLLTRLNRE